MFLRCCYLASSLTKRNYSFVIWYSLFIIQKPFLGGLFVLTHIVKTSQFGVRSTYCSPVFSLRNLHCIKGLNFIHPYAKRYFYNRENIIRFNDLLNSLSNFTKHIGSLYRSLRARFEKQSVANF
ncbi:hypothetical protein ALT1644_120068 [Alteromonas macleodii]